MYWMIASNPHLPPTSYPYACLEQAMREGKKFAEKNGDRVRIVTIMDGHHLTFEYQDSQYWIAKTRIDVDILMGEPECLYSS